ncbi:MAG TPA: thioesterase family protein [Actinomycetota bacterium]
MSEAAFEPDGAFFEPDADGFVATAHTRGPWDPDAQHAGPPAALLARTLERCEPREGFRIARITIEILRPVPLGKLCVEARLARPGRSVELLEASMSRTDGTPLLQARAWRIRTSDTTEVTVGLDDPPPRPPENGTEPPFFTTPSDFGYGHAMQWRFVKGSFIERGPAFAWLRMRHPLVTGEEPTPLQRVMIAADSGNGISATLDPRTHYFINTDLTVNLLRHPEGEWAGLDAVTRIGTEGIGLAETVLWDQRGRIGRGIQTLLAGPRS